MITATSPRIDDTSVTRLLPQVVEAAIAAGDRLLATYSTSSRVGDLDELSAALKRNEEASAPGLRAQLTTLRPTAAWLGDDEESASVPDGEFWVVDSVEGNVNHVHGLDEWCVSITLVRDGQPLLAVVRQPVGDHTYAAIRGEGATLDRRPLTVSTKSDLALAIAGTGQAAAGQRGTYRRIGESMRTMLNAALLVRCVVPSTFPLLLVANGHHDVFWQYEPTLPGIAAGILLATEAGAVVSRIDGTPWSTGSADILVTAPALQHAAVTALAAVG